MEDQTEQKYSAMDIAKYAINRRYKSNRPISNLQLQKILYFLQVIFTAKTGFLLFPDQSEAWPYGPIIREVYVEFADCGGYPIRREFDIDVGCKIKPFLDAGIDTLAEKAPWDLVRISNAEGSPWDVVYNREGRHKGTIPNGLIIQCVLNASTRR